MSVLDSIKQDVLKTIKNDSAHDFDHIMRVYLNAQKILENENASKKLVLSAVLLHDIVLYPKSDKRSVNTSIESAKKAKTILKKYDFTDDEIVIIYNAICDHSFSQKKIPHSMEGKILQDADRLDALGAIGIARDKTWTVDHFFAKLFKLEILMNTKTGKIEAKKRTKILRTFLKQLQSEI